MSGSHRCLSVTFALVLLLPVCAGGKPPLPRHHGGALPPGTVTRLEDTWPQPLPSLDTVALSPDGVFVAGATPVVRHIGVWDVRTGRLVSAIRSEVKPELYRLLFSPTGRYLASSWTGAVVVWETASGREVRRLGGFHEAPEGLFFSGSKGLTAIVLQGDELCWWDVFAGKILRRLDLFAGRKPRLLKPDQPEEQLGSIAVAPNGQTVAYSLARMALSDRPFGGVVVVEKNLFMVDVVGGKRRRLLQRKASLSPLDFVPLRLSPDGRLLVVGQFSTFYVFETASGKRVHRQETGQDYPVRLAFAGDGKTLAARRHDGKAWSIGIWDTRTWKLIRSLPAAADIGNLTLCGDGSTLALTHGSVLRLWDVTGGK